MSRAWRWLLVPAYPLLAVNAIAALLYAVLWCRAHSWAWRDGVLTFLARRRMLGNPGGQGWSWIVGYADEVQRARRDLRVHENVHVVQEIVWALAGLACGVAFWFAGERVAAVVAVFSGGLGFAVTYGLAFFVELVRRRHWRVAYYANVYERQAYARQDRYLAATPSERVAYWGHR